MAKQSRNAIINSAEIGPESNNTWTVTVRPAHGERPAIRQRKGLTRRELPSSAVSRFYSKIHHTTTCWLFMGGKFRNGYGMVNLGRDARGRQHTTYAHRVAYVLQHGSIPVGAVVMHSCDTPACVNPFHLSLGTQTQNVADAKAKGHYVNNGAHMRRRKTAA